MTEDEDFIVTFADTRGTGFCTSAMRDWFPRNGLDLKHFVKVGYPASVLLDTKDENARTVVENARKLRMKKHG